MTDKRLTEERTQLRLLAEGSATAFTLIYDYYRPKVYGTALKLLKDTTLAEEIVQEVFMKIWQRREALGDIQQFEGYLFMMARNHIFDSFKVLSKEDEMKSDYAPRTTINDTDHLVIDAQYQHLLDEAIEALPPQQKTIYRLTREEGLTQKQIGTQLDISPLTVKKHMAVALKTLREKLGHYIQVIIIIAMTT